MAAEDYALILQNTIRISLTGTPSGPEAPNVNSLAIFTTETPSNLDPYRVYLNASSVAEDFGTSAVTTKMANNIFAQSLNILSGRGRLIVIPLQGAVSATSGKWATTDISANLAALQAVTDGDIRVTLNGTAINLTGLDFTNATDFDDIATILQSKLPDAIVAGVSTTGFDVTSKKVGLASTVVVEQLVGGAGTDLSVAGLFNTAAGTPTAGANASGETIADAMTRISNDAPVDYTGLITNLEMEDAVLAALASTIQATKKIFLHHFSDINDLAGICTTIKDAGQSRTRCLLYTTSPAEANLMKAAYAGRAFSVNFSGSNTTITMNLKQLVNVLPDPGMNQTKVTQAMDAGVDMYINGFLKTSGENGAFFDSIYNRTWLQLNLEVAGFNALAQTNTKVPQTEQGLDVLKNAYIDILDRGVTNAFIGTGLTWNSSETFGDPEDLRRNITDTGYYVYSLPIAQQDQIERSNRIAPLIQIAVKEAGAIHESDVLVIIEQ